MNRWNYYILIISKCIAKSKSNIPFTFLYKFFIALLITTTFISVNTTAQNYFSIKGNVLEKNTNTPIPYTHLAIKGKSIGTITNLKGYFNYIIPSNYINNSDTLVISCMGYAPIKLYLIDLLKRDSTYNFFLEKNIILLDEVQINTQRINVREIVNTAISRIKLNYHQNPAILKGFYKEQMKETLFKKEQKDYKINNRYLEAAVDVYDKGYIKMYSKFKSKEIIELKSIRKKKDEEFSFHSKYNSVSDLLLSNPLKYNLDVLDKKKNKNYEFSIKGTINIVDQKIYIIEFKQAISENNIVLPEGSIYIRENDYAILKMEYGINKDRAQKQEKINYPFNNEVYLQIGYKKVNINFQEFNGVFYLEHIQQAFEIGLYQKLNNNPFNVIEIFAELFINEINTEHVLKPQKGCILDESKDIYNQEIKASSEFWEKYNFISD